MRDKIIPSPYPKEEPVDPRRAPGTEEEHEEPDLPDDDNDDEEAVPLPETATSSVPCKEDVT
jgi:hypothetical protein